MKAQEDACSEDGDEDEDDGEESSGRRWRGVFVPLYLSTSLCTCLLPMRLYSDDIVRLAHGIDIQIGGGAGGGHGEGTSRAHSPTNHPSLFSTSLN